MANFCKQILKPPGSFMQVFTAVYVINVYVQLWQISHVRSVIWRCSLSGNRLFRLQVDLPTSRSFRLHNQSRFTYTSHGKIKNGCEWSIALGEARWPHG